MAILQSLAKIFGFQLGKSSTQKVEVIKPVAVPDENVVSSNKSSNQNECIGTQSSSVKGNMSYIEPIGSTQEDVYEYLIGNPTGITFVHGKAGCGKTYLITKVSHIKIMPEK